MPLASGENYADIFIYVLLLHDKYMSVVLSPIGIVFWNGHQKNASLRQKDSWLSIVARRII